MESVLGRFMQALQVDDLTGFADTLSQLAEGDLALVESRATDAVDARNETLALPTVRSLLRDRSLAGSSLLYGVFAAESAEVALSKRHHLAPGQSIITREGFWVGPDWMRAMTQIKPKALLSAVERLSRWRWRSKRPTRN